ncbi:MAG TPA: hypothetical protein PK961_17035, partial [bacterium]|nr:hypothetical protein [bacterium]
MSDALVRRIELCLILLIVVSTFSINTLFVFQLNSDNFQKGYDHSALPVLLNVYHQFFPTDFSIPHHGHASPETVYIRLSLLAIKAFGLNHGSLYLMQSIVHFLILLFGYLISRKITDSSAAGWLTIAFLCLTPTLWGLLRTYTYWPLIIAAFLGLLYSCIRYRQDPTWKNAVLIGLFFFVMTRTKYDLTSAHIQLFYGFVITGLAFFDRYLKLERIRRQIWQQAALSYIIAFSLSIYHAFVGIYN